MKLKPWREIITPHDTVLQGTFLPSTFAADLSKVVAKTAPEEYQDPVLFFERTFITEGMGLLLNTVIKRLSGKGGDPVVQLQTAFGGGKTHAMLAVYHLSRGETPAKKLNGIPGLLDKAKVTQLPRANVAVLDGNSMSPSEPRKRGSLKVNTLWGEMAVQLGGEEGYQMLANADHDGTSPGKEILAALFKKFAPCVILMDETVAYIRQFEENKTYAGGTYGSNMAFVQALTEAAGHVPNAVVLASLPESDREAGGERGKIVLKDLEHLFHRLEAIWKPVSTEEGFEIVRRRLFAPITDTDARDAVCKAFAAMYESAGVYPSETKEARYLEKLRASYPFHPEVFDRLYEDWATMENFQRTRGVLRLMAMVVHRLWSDGNQDLMVMPGSLPLYDIQIRSELVRYLPTGWDPVVERDVDGPDAIPTRVDEQNPLLGQVQAARRVARSIFLGSAPAGTGQKIRGLNAEHVCLGCAQPAHQVGRFDDALKRLADQLHYLYSGNQRYWYDTQTNLRREAEDRMERFNRDTHLVPELAMRLRTLIHGRPFAGIHVFAPHGDIPDDQQIRLVVLPPTAPHQWHKKDTLAIRAAVEILQSRGDQPRHNKNRIIYLAADADNTGNLYNLAKRFLSWKSIVDDKDALNLDQHRLKEAAKNQKDAEDRLNGAVCEAYRWLLAPRQEQNKKGELEDTWDEQRVSTSEENPVETIIRVLREQEILIPEWSPHHLNDTLRAWYWKAGIKDQSVIGLWADFCKYPYLPRLMEPTVLQNTIAAGIETRDFFGYATAKDGERYLGLKFGAPGSVFMDKDSVLIHPDVAKAQQEAEAKVGGGKGGDQTGMGTGTGVTTTGTGTTGKGGGTTPKKVYHRFHGSVSLKPVSAALDFSKIAEEVIQHFSSKVGTEVKINLEVEAQSAKGFDDATRRTVQENSRTLGFDHADFEEE